MRVLCSEPWNFRPWEVAKLTPVQARVLVTTRRDKQGHVVLDPPADDGPAELDLAGEFRAEWVRRGVTDPDALALLVDHSLEDDDYGGPAGPDGDGGFGGDE